MSRMDVRRLGKWKLAASSSGIDRRSAGGSNSAFKIPSCQVPFIDHESPMMSVCSYMNEDIAQMRLSNNAAGF